MKKTLFKICAFISVVVLFVCSGCMKPAKLKVGLVDPARLISSWPRYQEMAIKFQEEALGMDTALPKDLNNLSSAKRKKIIEVGEKWQKVGKELSEEIRKAAETTAKKEKLDLVIINTVVEYGGKDVTEFVKSHLR